MTPQALRAIRAAAPVIVLALLAACSGASTSATPPAPAAHATSQPGATGSASITIIVPQGNPRSRARRPAYVSPATGSLAATPNGGSREVFALSPSSAGCQAGPPLTCTVTVSMPVGQNQPLTLATFASSDGTGTPLSVATVTVNVAPGAANPVTVTLNGVVASLNISLVPPTVQSGSPATVNVIVNVLDASGATIIGPGSYADGAGTPVTISLTNSDASGSTTLSTASITQPGTTVTLSYNGSPPFAGATITAQAPGITPKSANLQVTAARVQAVYTSDGKVFDANANGNVAPLRARTICPVTPGTCYAGTGVAVDAVHRELYYLNQGLAPGSLPPAVVVIDLDAPDGIVSPKRTITGANTKLAVPQGIAYEPSTGNVYVANARCTYPGCISTDGSIVIFHAGASGDVPPDAAIVGDSAYLSNLRDVALYGSTLYASGDGARSCPTNSTNSCTDGPVLAFTLPIAGVQTSPPPDYYGAKEGVIEPQGIAADGSGLYVANAPSMVPGYGVYFFPPPDSVQQFQGSSHTLVRTIGSMSRPFGVALDGQGGVFVCDNGFNGRLRFYPAGATTPARTIEGTVAHPNCGGNIATGPAPR